MRDFLLTQSSPGRGPFVDYGYRELTIPAADDGSHQLANDGLHIWPRHNLMLIALPNLDGSFTATQFYADIEGHPEDANVRLALDELSYFTARMEILGVYPAAAERG